MTSSLTYRGPALPRLHDQYAKQHRIDEHAPIRGRREIVISAPPARVWAALIDVANWGTALEPGATDIRVDDGVRPGAQFSRTNRGARMRATFAVVEDRREIAWTGTAFGAKAVHRFELHVQDDGRTRVVTEESMAGPLLGLFFGSDKLSALLDTSLNTLKTTVERQP
jgi:hypothetical protein